MPSPAVTRELGVTYAGVTLGGTSDTNLLFDRHEVRGGYETIGFTGRVLVRADTEAAFATACATLEAAFSTPNGTLVIAQGSATMKSFGHSGSYLVIPKATLFLPCIRMFPVWNCLKH